MELQIPHSVCTEVSEEGILSGKMSGGGKDITTVVRMERGAYHRSRSVPRPHPYAGRNTAKDVGIQFHGIPEGKEYIDDL